MQKSTYYFIKSTHLRVLLIPSSVRFHLIYLNQLKEKRKLFIMSTSHGSETNISSTGKQSKHNGGSNDEKMCRIMWQVISLLNIKHSNNYPSNTLK